MKVKPSKLEIMSGQGRTQGLSHHMGKESGNLGYVIDPLYGKLHILQIGDAGENRPAFLVEGPKFGPDWREESELISVHLTEAGRKKVGHLG